jgi:DNA excision repair protein ERCC-5
VISVSAREKQLDDATSYIPSNSAYEYQPEEGEIITADDVYLDELDGPQPLRPQPHLAPARTNSSMTSDGAGPSIHQQQATDEAEEIANAQAERRKKFKNADPYRLPDLPGPIGISAAQGANGKTKADPRLATEEELKTFIETMKPEDFDVNSPEFRALPTDVQYEIIGDLRIRSRQQSHRRLASMLRAAPTPLDFSKAQIANLSKRNTLTQQLLTVTDTIGSSNLQIPVRVASERNREYVLVRNTEADGGGWVLGVRDQGSKEKPIEIEESPQSKKRKEAKARRWLNSDDEDSDVEEIPP